MFFRSYNEIGTLLSGADFFKKKKRDPDDDVGDLGLDGNPAK